MEQPSVEIKTTQHTGETGAGKMTQSGAISLWPLQCQNISTSWIVSALASTNTQNPKRKYFYQPGLGFHKTIVVQSKP